MNFVLVKLKLALTRKFPLGVF